MAKPVEDEAPEVIGPGLPGRAREAARNDVVILAAAREVFLADPKAPIAAVAARAGVGISALYRRYPSKDQLLRTLCRDGLQRYNAEAEAALGDTDHWRAFTQFLHRVVEADVHSLTVHLAGTFTPTEQMHHDAMRSGQLTDALVERAHASGRLRTDIVSSDLTLILETCAAIRHPDAERTRQLRRRHLALLIDGLTATGELPGPAPQPEEVTSRWRT